MARCSSPSLVNLHTGCSCKHLPGCCSRCCVGPPVVLEEINPHSTDLAWDGRDGCSQQVRVRFRRSQPLPKHIMPCVFAIQSWTAGREPPRKPIRRDRSQKIRTNRRSSTCHLAGFWSLGMVGARLQQAQRDERAPVLPTRAFGRRAWAGPTATRTRSLCSRRFNRPLTTQRGRCVARAMQEADGLCTTTGHRAGTDRRPSLVALALLCRCLFPSTHRPCSSRRQP